ncbi:unnamed protein product [Periconia digitata]|uniref:Uncharacterized protein n=1 Tax=Periconia digitata TaxID=1303443 RepID=A0A9W4XRW9_9PLEO|nr:unnamed protein product [Periconia digitata]
MSEPTLPNPGNRGERGNSNSDGGGSAFDSAVKELEASLRDPIGFGVNLREVGLPRSSNNRYALIRL